MEDAKKLFCCKGIRLANYLINKKCTIVRVDKDRTRDEQRVVFIFLNDDALSNALNKWKTEKEIIN